MKTAADFRWLAALALTAAAFAAQAQAQGQQVNALCSADQGWCE